MLIGKQCVIVGGMESTENLAVAAYFQTLRNNRQTPDGRRMTQTYLAQEIGVQLGRKVDQSTISKIEAGRSPLMGDIMAALLAALGGDIRDVLFLFRKTSPSEGRTRALARIEEQAKEIADQIDDVAEAQRMLRGLQASPDVLESLRRLITDGALGDAG